MIVVRRTDTGQKVGELSDGLKLLNYSEERFFAVWKRIPAQIELRFPAAVQTGVECAIGVKLVGKEDELYLTALDQYLTRRKYAIG